MQDACQDGSTTAVSSAPSLFLEEPLPLGYRAVWPGAGGVAGWRQARTKETMGAEWCSTDKGAGTFFPVGIGGHAYPANRASKARGRDETREAHERMRRTCLGPRARVLRGHLLAWSFPCAVLESYKQSSVRVRRDTRKNRELVHAGLGAQLCHYHQGRREELRMMRALAVSSNFFFCRIPHPCDYLQLS